jgi:hypothetical protein
MSIEAMLPCLICGKVLRNWMPECVNQPYDGTEFRTYGAYGSTFWDDFDGEELVLTICDDCLRERTSRLARHQRYRTVVCEGYHIGRESLDREMVPYFDGLRDDEKITVEIEEVGTKMGRIEWVEHWAEIKKYLRETVDK